MLTLTEERRGELLKNLNKLAEEAHSEPKDGTYNYDTVVQLMLVEAVASVSLLIVDKLHVIWESVDGIDTQMETIKGRY